LNKKYNKNTNGEFININFIKNKNILLECSNKKYNKNINSEIMNVKFLKYKK